VAGPGAVVAPLFATVTACVAVAVWPFMVTVAVTVRLPLPAAVVSHVYQNVVAVGNVCDVRVVPSTDSVNVLVVPSPQSWRSRPTVLR